MSSDAIVVGAGLSGLACAGVLARAGRNVLVLEAGDGVGGRARTDRVDGFLLDRGFQVLFTAYPEAQEFFDYAALELRPFWPGALIRMEGRLERVTDPWRKPGEIVTTLFSSVGTLSDKLRMARLRRDVTYLTLQELVELRESTTERLLARYGFSQRMVTRFFRPFFGGVFLESELKTSSRLFSFFFRMMALGDIALPARGMGELAAQLAARLPAGSLRLNTTVAAAGAEGVVLSTGERLEARAVVLATDWRAAARLDPGIAQPRSRPAVCLYFAAPRPPVEQRILMLNGTGEGRVNHVAVPSLVAPAYAPEGQALVAVTLAGGAAEPDAELEAAVRAELDAWFPGEVQAWRLLRIYRIADALPDQSPPTVMAGHLKPRLDSGLYACGDYRDLASINGALASGRLAAEEVLRARI
jgi:phytoene dehydrogenase-like protein